MDFFPRDPNFPMAFPGSCICGTQTGLIADTRIDRGNQRIYVCEACFHALERVFIGGEKTEKRRTLMAAAKTVAAKDAQIAERDEKIHDYADQLLATSAEALRLQEQLEVANGKVAQFEHLLSQAARTLIEAQGVSATVNLSEVA